MKYLKAYAASLAVGVFALVVCGCLAAAAHLAFRIMVYAWTHS